MSRVEPLFFAGLQYLVGPEGLFSFRKDCLLKFVQLCQEIAALLGVELAFEVEVSCVFAIRAAFALACACVSCVPGSPRYPHPLTRLCVSWLAAATSASPRRPGCTRLYSPHSSSSWL